MADLTAVRDALLAHEWEPGRRWSVHATHSFSASCAICQGDVLRMLEIAAPLLGARVETGDATAD